MIEYRIHATNPEAMVLGEKRRQEPMFYYVKLDDMIPKIICCGWFTDTLTSGSSDRR